MIFASYFQVSICFHLPTSCDSYIRCRPFALCLWHNDMDAPGPPERRRRLWLVFFWFPPNGEMVFLWCVFLRGVAHQKTELRSTKRNTRALKKTHKIAQQMGLPTQKKCLKRAIYNNKSPRKINNQPKQKYRTQKITQ